MKLDFVELYVLRELHFGFCKVHYMVLGCLMMKDTFIVSRPVHIFQRDPVESSIRLCRDVADSTCSFIIDGRMPRVFVKSA